MRWLAQRNKTKRDPTCARVAPQAYSLYVYTFPERQVDPRHHRRQAPLSPRRIAPFLPSGARLRCHVGQSACVDGGAGAQEGGGERGGWCQGDAHGRAQPAHAIACGHRQACSGCDRTKSCSCDGCQGSFSAECRFAATCGSNRVPRQAGAAHAPSFLHTTPGDGCGDGASVGCLHGGS